MKQIINCETGEIIERELNEIELAQAAIDAEMIAEIKLEVIDKAEAKFALLKRLGITEDEAKLLLS